MATVRVDVLLVSCRASVTAFVDVPDAERLNQTGHTHPSMSVDQLMSVRDEGSTYPGLKLKLDQFRQQLI